jgi:uncharacterized protein (DUF488 family)
MGQPLFTIGHSTHPTEKFLELLGLHEITAVCDVRSSPYSRYNPQYNRSNLEETLRACGIRYVFLGRELGARSEDPNCYQDGKVVYQKVAETPLFLEGLRRVRKGIQTQRVALMCAEKDPLTCHRCILICRHLRTPEVDISHILDSGALEKHCDTELRLLDTLGIAYPNLFEETEELIERAYDIQGRKIAYTESEAPESTTIPNGGQGCSP